jgi:TolB-like protein
VKKIRKINLLLMVLALLLPFWGCAGKPSAPVYIKDGKEYGKVRGAFRYRWWNYYERGLSYIEGEFYQEALADLKEGIQQRAKDQRMARTYGMHFIDYFPHRESGIIYYQLGNLGEAKGELELSLRHFPSAKARFYLDRVRKALIEKEGREIAPPRLTLNFKTDEVWTREDPVVLSGVAEDEQYVAAITIRSVPLFLEGSEKHIPFKEPLLLSQGRHIIEVEAKNLLGMVIKRNVVLNVDREGPMITLDEIQLDRTRPEELVTILGSIYDEAGVSGLSINGKSIPIHEGVEVLFTERLKIDAECLDLKAIDRLGNQTAARIPLSSVSTGRKPVLFACADPIVVNSIVAALFGPKDTRPPNIKLRGWTDIQTVFMEKVYIEGQISDESKIESLTINQIPILRRKGKRIFFNHLAELEKGKNTITIEARDKANNVASKKITITRRVPKALQLTERLSLTVLPFEQKGAVSESSLFFQDNVIDALVNQNRFQVVERDRLDLILQEQKLSRTKLIDRSTALRLGRLVAVHSIITGSIIETRTGIEIVGRMIDTETSEILATEDVYDEIKDLPALRTLAEGMAIKFHREFPLLGGFVIQQKGKYIFTDLGQDKIKLQRRLIVYREEPIKHPVTGKILGADNEIVGRAKVTQVLPEMSKAELMRGKPGAIKRLDKVITE